MNTKITRNTLQSSLDNLLSNLDLTNEVVQALELNGETVEKTVEGRRIEINLFAIRDNKDARSYTVFATASSGGFFGDWFPVTRSVPFEASGDIGP